MFYGRVCVFFLQARFLPNLMDNRCRIARYPLIVCLSSEYAFFPNIDFQLIESSTIISQILRQ